MNGELMLYIDQYGGRFYARTVRELREKVGGGRVGRMFVDKTDGSTAHVGYVIGRRWLAAFTPYEKTA